MKKLIGPLVAVAVAVGVLWVAKELKGLVSFEFDIFDEEPGEEKSHDPTQTFWKDLDEDLKDPVFAARFQEELRILSKGTNLSDYFLSLADAPKVDLYENLRAFKRHLDEIGEDRAAEQFEADVVAQTGTTFGGWLQSPEGKRALQGLEESVENVQHHGDYVDALGDDALTLADLEGISVPDLTTIVEQLKQPKPDVVDQSFENTVSLHDFTDPASTHENFRIKIDADDPDVVDDYVIDEPVTNSVHHDPDGPFLDDGPFKGYPLSDPRRNTSAPSPTAEAPGDVSTVWADVIKESIGVEPEPYNVQLANQPKD